MFIQRTSFLVGMNELPFKEKRLISGYRFPNLFQAFGLVTWEQREIEQRRDKGLAPHTLPFFLSSFNVLRSSTN